jgi:hypothetical protein
MTTAMILALMAGAAGHAKAGLIRTFDAEGTFDDGATLSGTLSIDTTIGTVTSANLVVGAPDSLDFIDIQFQGGNIYPGDYFIQAGTTPSGLPNLLLVLPTDSLVGYSGGPIGSDTNPANGYVSSIYLGATLTDGSLTAVPEPSGLLLGTVAGLAGTGYVWRRRRRFPARGGKLVSFRRETRS